MKFYTFNSDFQLIDELEDAGFTGCLFVYHPKNADYFTQIARDVDVHKKIKYMLAVRPYVVSPEHLVALNNSIKQISGQQRLQINLVSGHIKPDEEDLVRTIGKITNKSSKEERSKYLIEYIDMLNTLNKDEKPDYYVTTTNDFIFNAASKNNDKMIIEYKDYAKNKFDIKNLKNIMINIGPIIRNTQEELDIIVNNTNNDIQSNNIYCTQSQLKEIIRNIESKGIKEVMLWAFTKEELNNIIDFVKKYNKEKQ